MNNSTRKKKEQLGINPSTASAVLKKNLMFRMARQLGDDYCFHCGARICTVQEFSIEHKVPWLDSDDPEGLFFDLNNIAFSHLRCNIQAAKRIKAMCGTERSYRKGCRCVKCTEANAHKMRKYRNKDK